MSCGKWLVQYPNDILVETGSGLGGGIQYALRYGFKQIHSIEIDPNRHQFCEKLFRKNPEVHLYLGDSIETLPKILDGINQKATFLLDAHIMQLSEVHGKVICPILQELTLIIGHAKKLGIKHSILIDDAKLFNGSTESFDNIKSESIKQAILELDATYTVSINKRTITAV